MTNYKKILKHRLYERYMNNPAEFRELCKLLDDIDEVIMQNDTISREAACDAIAAADITNGTMPVFSGKQVQEILMGLPRFQPKQKTSIWEYDSSYNGFYRCASCGHDQGYKTNYCPRCGARMEAKDETL